MNLIVKMQFGSHIYGTNLPTSDQDFKAIYIPEPRDIILQRARGTISHSTKKDPNAKNSADDIDLETFSLQQYMKLLLEGQTVAMDMLFTPEKFITVDGWDWCTIVENKDKFLHKGYSSFAGYCKTQANKYGIKGSRVAAMRSVLAWLKNFDPDKRLAEIGFDGLMFGDQYHTHLVEMNAPNGTKMSHLEVCNRKVSFSSKVGYAISIYQKIFDEYGARALAAEKEGGVDWKALMHAVRICHQSKELLLTGNIEFPRPEAALLLQIRKGELPYKQVAEMIENGLEEMEQASLKSMLPALPNYKWAEDLIYDSYRTQFYYE